jgi:DNA-binding transcriptional MerR regulator
VPIEVNGELYFTTVETCQKTGISRATLSRWLRQGVLKELRKDRKGWRLFTEDDLNKLKVEIGRIEVEKLP